MWLRSVDVLIVAAPDVCWPSESLNVFLSVLECCVPGRFIAQVSALYSTVLLSKSVRHPGGSEFRTGISLCCSESRYWQVTDFMLI